MRVILDHSAPAPLRRYLTGHTVTEAFEQGWERLENGDLLAAAEEAGFDVLVTSDKNMSYQQNLAGRTIAIVVLGQGQWPALRPHVQLVLDHGRRRKTTCCMTGVAKNTVLKLLSVMPDARPHSFKISQAASRTVFSLLLMG